MPKIRVGRSGNGAVIGFSLTQRRNGKRKTCGGGGPENRVPGPPGQEDQVGSDQPETREAIATETEFPVLLASRARPRVARVTRRESTWATPRSVCPSRTAALGAISGIKREGDTAVMHGVSPYFSENGPSLPHDSAIPWGATSVEPANRNRPPRRTGGCLRP